MGALHCVQSPPTIPAVCPPLLRYFNVAKRFFKEQGFKHVVMMSADGALEAAPAMGSADIILDLVSRHHNMDQS